MNNLEKKARLDEAKKLILGAGSALADGMFPEGAIWRLVDAAGLIAQTLPTDRLPGLCGLHAPTARGFRLDLGKKER